MSRKLQKDIVPHLGGIAMQRAADNFAKRDYCLMRGHREYVAKAYENSNMYMGGGLQWSAEDRQIVESEDRRCVEENRIMGIVNTAVGYQIANRMDISLRPRGRGADDELATTLQKVIKKVCDDNRFHWAETDVVTDGFIEQRGYYDVRISFDENIYGDIVISTLDPRGVMPCPDSNTYDSNLWPYVLTEENMTLDRIEAEFGKSARRSVELMDLPVDGGEEMQTWKQQFGDPNHAMWQDWITENDGSKQYLVITRQYKVFERTQCAVWPTGDVRPIPDATPEQIAAYKKQGAVIMQRPKTRWKFLVTTANAVLFDDYSPFPWCTVVPYFPYFRRGLTRGLVDNVISSQLGLNKALGQLENTFDHVSNSGWLIEENSLTNITIDEAKTRLAQNGAVVVYKQGSTPPKKIDPPQVPAGLVEMINTHRRALADAIGEALDNSGPQNEMSGVAYQARQYASQQKLAIPLDNLARTRHMVAERIIDLIQMFKDAPEILRITETDPYGQQITEEVYVNQPTETGDYLNDLTIGEYDLVISEQPMQVTFDNSQFEQAMRMIEAGVPIPPAFLLRYSSLSEKVEIAKGVEAAQQAQPNPEVDAKVQLMLAQAEKMASERVNKDIEAVYGATQAAAQIATLPQVAGIADEILQSAGFEDKNPAPIIPQLGAGLASVAPPVPTVAPVSQGTDPTDPSTNPTTPENPGIGLTAGIETPGPTGDV
jgi:hypothetical protein